MPQAPYSVTARRKSTACAPALVSHTPPTLLCPAHCLPTCSTCKRLHISATVCYSKGHHNSGHVDWHLQSKTCTLHGLPPYPRCTLMQWGVRHCCARGHHKLCTPAPTRNPPAAPTLSKPLTLSPDALTTRPTHTASPQTTETQAPPPPPCRRPPCHRACQRRKGWTWYNPCSSRGTEG